ncbi:MAG: peptidyl-prolyl cis-trans isomerase [Azoarcus sp.]|jgi:peptidyl-prolyl cis-trans isomerase C|nr:peptidyl-prolyl cis-trans isomerase [Azoarcus sp.]
MKFTAHRLTVALVAAGLLALSGCAGDQVGSGNAAKAGAMKESIATVNGVPIPKYYVDVMVAAQVAQGAQQNDPNLQESIRKELIRRAVLEQAALKAGIDKQDETAAKQAISQQNVLIGDYLQDWMKNNPPTDDELQKAYDTIKERLGDKEYHARHILVGTEQEANDIIASLKKGTKFATLVKKSRDPGSKDQGGDLGWTNPASLLPSFSAAMSKLEKGKYTTAPVKTEYGYHVILLEDVRDQQAPPFDEVKPQLQMGLQQKKVQEYIEQLEKSAVVKETEVKQPEANQSGANQSEASQPETK